MARADVRSGAYAARRVGIACALLASAASAQFAVSDNGQPTYSIPIPVPPGAAGMEPKLALNYAPGLQAGALGYGWTLTGLSVITRCGSTMATDGVRKGVRYTSEDRLCLDGQRLIQTDAQGTPTSQAGYGAANTEYRTEKDSYARIRAYGGTAATGAESFKVWSKAGLVYEYGATTDSRIFTSGRSPAAAMAWAVNRIWDTAGNYIAVEYTVMDNAVAGSAGREWLVARIRYTGHRSGRSPFARVEFGYESRPDPGEAYHEGAKSVSTRRLASIRTYVGASPNEVPVLAIFLAYQASPATGRSLLESVRTCDGSNPARCLPKTQFAYTPGPGLDFRLQQPASLTGVPLAALDQGRGRYTRGPLPGDFNGDGRQDLLIWDEDPSRNHLLLARPDGSFAPVATPLTAPIGHGDGCHHGIVADFDLDGIADVLQVSDREADSSGKCSGITPSAAIHRGSSTGTFGARVQVTDEGGRALPLVRADPVYLGGWSTCGPNEPADACSGVAPVSILRGGSTFYVADVDGDGVPDILVTNSQPGRNGDVPSACAAGERTCLFLGSRQRPGIFTKTATSLAGQDLFSPRNEAHGRVGVPGTYAENRVFVGDLNADGLPDLLVRDKGDRYIATGVPGQFVRRQGGVAPCLHGLEVLDINGDGKWDLACMDPVRDGPYQAYVNDGAGNFSLRGTVGPWVGSSTCQVGAGQNPSPGPCEPTAYRGRVVYLAADIDGDGVSDILAAGKREYALHPSRNALLRGGRDGSFQRATSNLDPQDLSTGTLNLLAGDFTGRGAVELLRYSHDPAQSGLFIRTEGPPPDLLKSVTSPEGAQTLVDYKPLTDAGVYAKGTGSADPVVDLVSAQWVVAKVQSPNGRGGFVGTSWSYEGLRADLAGRGSLGFAAVRKTTPAVDGTRVTTETKYRQDFPFVGLPSETRRFLTDKPIAQALSVVRTDYQDWHMNGCADRRIFRAVARRSTEESRDLDGSPIARVETANADYNCHGDVGSVTVTTTGLQDGSRVYRKTTVNTWLAANTSGESWILGRLASAKQINTVPDGLPAKEALPGAPPTLEVQANPDPLVAGQSYEVSWRSSNATTVGYQCTAAGSGFAGQTTLPTTSGAARSTALEAWVGSPSNCVWTATGPGGKKTVTHVLTTVRNLSLTVQVNPSTLVAGKGYTVTWASSGATSVGYKCTASGSGFAGAATLPTTSGASPSTALAQWVGYPSTCLWTAQGAAGTKTVTSVLNTVAGVDLQVRASPDPLVAGQSYEVSWSSTGATTVGYQCTAAGSGFAGATTLPTTSGSSRSVALDAWVDYPSNCLWTASGPSGTKTVTTTLRTVAASTPAPTLSVQLSRNPFVAGEPYTVSWSSTHAAAVSYQCTAAGTGFRGSTVLPTTSGSSPSVAPKEWVGYPSNCVWTATGPGGTRTLAVTLTTVAPPLPTVSVRFSPYPLTAGSPFSNTWTTTNATSLRYACTAAGSGFAGSAQVAVNDTSGGVAPYEWVNYPSTCVWTATGPGGSATFTHSIVTLYPIQAGAGP